MAAVHTNRHHHRLRRVLCGIAVAVAVLAGASASAQPFKVGFGITLARTQVAGGNVLTFSWDSSTVRASNWLTAYIDSVRAVVRAEMTDTLDANIPRAAGGLSASALRDSLNALMTATSGRRLTVANLSLGTNGQYLVMFGGSPTWVTPTWATSVEIADSIKALFGGPRKFHHTQVNFTGFSVGISSDSAARLGREFIFHGYFAPAAAGDTALGQAFGKWAYGTYLSGRFVSGHTDVALVVKSIVVEHVFDSSFSSYAKRDTVVTYTVRDSIPASSSIGFSYRPAQAALQYIQAVRVLYTPYQSTSTTVAGEEIQLPLILGVSAYNRGLRHATHAVSVTLKCVEKIPGRIY